MNQKTIRKSMFSIALMSGLFSGWAVAMKTLKEKKQGIPSPSLLELNANNAQEATENTQANPANVQEEKNLTYPFDFISKEIPLDAEIQEKIGTDAFILSFEKMVLYACLDPNENKFSYEKETHLLEVSQSPETFCLWLNDEIRPNITKYFSAPADENYLERVLNMFEQGKDHERLRQITILFFAGFDYYQMCHHPFTIELREGKCYFVSVCNEGIFLPTCLFLEFSSSEYLKNKVLTFPQFSTNPDLDLPCFSVTLYQIFWHEIGHIMHTFFSINQHAVSFQSLLENQWLTEFLFPDLAPEKIEQTKKSIVDFVQNQDHHEVSNLIRQCISLTTSSEDFKTKVNKKDRSEIEALANFIFGQLGAYEASSNAISSEFKEACYSFFKYIVYFYAVWCSSEEISQIMGLMFINGNIFINPFCDGVLWENKRYTHSNDKIQFLKTFPFINIFPTKANIQLWCYLLGLDFDACVNQTQNE